ncbi:MAG: hypothetical protein JWO45_115, partial [Spartobacteria bacterium]|nr:hypothetical protein [Spartobacteria bacterium]
QNITYEQLGVRLVKRLLEILHHSRPDQTDYRSKQDLPLVFENGEENIMQTER